MNLTPEEMKYKPKDPNKFKPGCTSDGCKYHIDSGQLYPDCECGWALSSRVLNSRDKGHEWLCRYSVCYNPSLRVEEKKKVRIKYQVTLMGTGGNHFEDSYELDDEGYKELMTVPENERNEYIWDNLGGKEACFDSLDMAAWLEEK